MQPILEGEFASTVFWEGGDDVEMSADIDGDGIKEKIIVGRDHPNSTRILVRKGDEGVNLKHPTVGFDGHGDLKPGFYCQLTVEDVTNDGYPEILFAVSGRAAMAQLDVWQFDRNKWASTPRGQFVNPYTRIAEIQGQYKFRILPGGKIIAPYGSVGLFNRYDWNGEKFVEVDPVRPTD